LTIVKKRQCSSYGYIFVEECCPDQDIEPGTKWEDVAESFTSPERGAGKNAFELVK